MVIQTWVSSRYFSSLFISEVSASFIPVENIWKVHKKPITNNQEYLFSKIPYKSDELSLSLSLVWLILVAAQSLTCSETIDSQFCMVFYWIDILTTAELGRGALAGGFFTTLPLGSPKVMELGCPRLWQVILRAGQRPPKWAFTSYESDSSEIPPHFCRVKIQEVWIWERASDWHPHLGLTASRREKNVSVVHRQPVGGIWL